MEIIRKAKAEGVDVTCETGPHYLVMDDSFLKEEGRFKMNPPLRSAEDREALIKGIIDGTIDCIATDQTVHAAARFADNIHGPIFAICSRSRKFSVPCWRPTTIWPSSTR